MRFELKTDWSNASTSEVRAGQLRWSERAYVVTPSFPRSALTIVAGAGSAPWFQKLPAAQVVHPRMPGPISWKRAHAAGAVIGRRCLDDSDRRAPAIRHYRNSTARPITTINADHPTNHALSDSLAYRDHTGVILRRSTR